MGCINNLNRGLIFDLFIMCFVIEISIVVYIIINQLYSIIFNIINLYPFNM